MVIFSDTGLVDGGQSLPWPQDTVLTNDARLSVGYWFELPSTFPNQEIIKFIIDIVITVDYQVSATSDRKIQIFKYNTKSFQNSYKVKFDKSWNSVRSN